MEGLLSTGPTPSSMLYIKDVEQRLMLSMGIGLNLVGFHYMIKTGRLNHIWPWITTVLATNLLMFESGTVWCDTAIHC